MAKPSYKTGNGVNAFKFALKQADNAIASESCCDCSKPLGRKEMTNYKGTRCTKCLLKFMESEYDTTPNDCTARFMIREGKDSPFVRYATQEQRKYAVEYYKKNGKPEPTIQEQMELVIHNNLDKL